MAFFRKKPNNRGFSLLEVMVSLAILAGAIVPLLLLREQSYDKAIFTNSVRRAQSLAQDLLTQISLEVRSGDKAGTFEGYDNFTFEYKVTIYDFGGGMVDEEEDDDDPTAVMPSDGVLLEDDIEGYGPMVMRHVELTVYYPMPSYQEGEEDELCEYIIDTYIPVLLTEEQYNNSQEALNGE